MSTNMKTIVMFQAHATTLATLREYRSISEAVAGIAESRLLLHSTTDRDSPCSLPRDSYVVTDATLAGLGYPQFEPGVSAANVHFPLLQFFAEHSRYDFYWLLQYDVRFTGSWRDFFQAFLGNTVDFLTSHIREYADEPNWHLWRLLHHPKHYIPYSKRVRSFNPVCRMSRSALVQLEEAHRGGWAGHFEVLVPTLLRQNGASLQDLGGCGKFVPEEARNCFYLEGPENANGILDGGTLRSDPVFQEVGPEKNKLYHPVRPVEFIPPPAINKSSGTQCRERSERLLR